MRENLKAYGDDPMMTSGSIARFLLDGERRGEPHWPYMQIQSTDTKNNKDEQAV
jgi:hypothetical protein